MIASAVVILAVGLIAFMWVSRGFLSAFLHMLCVLVAGAVALAVWEPFADVLLTKTGGGMLSDNAWAIALAGPFILTLVVTRVALDKLVPANTDLSRVVNGVGAGVCGLVSGVITVGIAIVAAGYTRIGPDLGLGYRPVDYSKQGGSLVRESKLILPADYATTTLYTILSEGLFRPFGGDSLARWRPEMWEEGTLLRTNFEDGKARSTFAPGAFEVLGYYVYAPKDADDLLSEGTQKTPQSYQYLDGERASGSSSEIIGVAVRFTPGAKEKSGRVVIGPAQVRLIAQTDPNDELAVMPVQPAAMISQAESSRPARGRWRFEAKDTFIASVGGRDDAPMVFEFPVPKGSVPSAVYIKGVRHVFRGASEDQPPKPFATFTTQEDRDAAIRSGGIIPGASLGQLERGGAVNVKTENNSTTDNMIRIDSGLPLGLVLAKDGLKGLTVDESGGIDGGELSLFSEKELANRGIDLNLAVRRFAVSDDTVMFQVVVDKSNTKFGFLSEAARRGVDKSKPPVLVDNTGAPYSPVGFIYKDSAGTQIYFNPQSPIRAVEGDPLPTITISKPEQQLTLLYRVSKGVKITSFVIGDKVVAEFKPALDASR